jgi:hypothetical protein
MYTIVIMNSIEGKYIYLTAGVAAVVVAVDGVGRGGTAKAYKKRKLVKNGTQSIRNRPDLTRAEDSNVQ